MTEVVLAGLGFAGAAGLNAWLPTLVLAIAARAGGVELAGPYDQIASDPGLAILVAGTLIDFVADKIPAVDSVVHAVGTVIHPAAGAIVAAGQAGADVPPAAMLLSGALTSGGIHAGRAAVRPLATSLTGGIANPFLSLFEDVESLSIALIALAVPLVAFALVLALLALIAYAVIWARRSRSRRLRRGRP